VVLTADEKYNLLNNVRTELNITVLIRQSSTAKTGKTLQQQGSEQRMPGVSLSTNEEHRAAAAASPHRWLENQRVAIEK
jgi:hypothetical protein